MGKQDGKPHAEGIERKKLSRASLVDEGFDPVLEEQCRAIKAEEELRVYWVDKCLDERAAAREAHKARRAAAKAGRQAAAAAAAAPPVEEAVPAPAQDLPAEEAVPAAPAQALPAEEAVPAPAAN